MPHYEIFHTCSMRPSQLQHLAKAITNLHCTTFSAPSMFVNITFHCYDGGNRGLDYSRTMFVGGREVTTNYIIGHLRDRSHLPSAKSTLDTLTSQISTVWNEVMRPQKPGRLEDPLALHNIFLMGDIAAGAEQGFVLPLAGEDAKWIEENRNEFERRAGEGEASMKNLLAEVERGLGKAPLG